MARAGAAVAEWLIGRLPALASAGRQPVLLLAGPGNNGGDAYVAARELHRRGVRVDVWQLGAPSTDDARWAHAHALSAGVPIQPAPALWPQPSSGYAWIVDGLFGIGLTRPLDGPAAALVAHIVEAHAQGTPVLAIDIPSGLAAATGVVDGPVIHADVTMAMLGASPGLLTGMGRDVAGDVLIATLGTDEVLAAVRSGRPDGQAIATSAPAATGPGTVLLVPSVALPCTSSVPKRGTDALPTRTVPTRSAPSCSVTVGAPSALVPASVKVESS